MSYILDALKKAEKERQRGTVPDVLTVQETSTSKIKNYRALLYILLPLLLINVSIFILWTIFSPVKIQTIAPASKATVEKELESKIFVDDKESVPKQNQNIISVLPKQNAQLKKKTDETFQQGRSKNIVSNIPQNTNDKSTKDKRIFDFNDLPASVRQGLPSMSMSVHYYSDIPSSRMININGRTLKEGQELAAGLRLEEITQQGAVFSYQDSLFHIEQNK